MDRQHSDSNYFNSK